MPPSDQTPDLDPRLTDLVEKAVERVREEFLRRLEETREHFERMIGPERPSEAIPEAAAEPAAAEPLPSPPGFDLLEQLRSAVVRIDQTRSQEEILDALVDAGRGFASRAALFLTRQDGFRGWGAAGFPADSAAIGDLVLPYGSASALDRLSEGRGGVVLGPDDCSAICERLDDSRPRSGALIPLVLRDRIAAALYADTLEDEPDISVTALQLLCFVAAQTLETLPLRDRASTVTLRLDHEARADEPALELWRWPGADTAPAPEAAPAEPEAETPPESEWLEPEAVPSEMEGAEPGIVPAPADDEMFETLEAAPVEAPAAVERDFETPWDLQPEPEPSPEVVAAEPEVEEPEVEEPEVEVEPQPEEEAAPVAEPEEPTLEEEDTLPEPVMPEPEIPAPVDLRPATDSGFDLESPTEAAEAPSQAVIDRTLDEEGTRPGLALEPEPEASKPLESPSPPTVTGAEVLPPPDVDGPGWAFGSRQRQSDDAEESRHDEARRLARLLATEIKLYNEEQVEEGRRNRNLGYLLREDIERSRQIYEERVDPDVREETDYFDEELVRILAGGDPGVLG